LFDPFRETDKQDTGRADKSRFGFAQQSQPRQEDTALSQLNDQFKQGLNIEGGQMEPAVPAASQSAEFKLFPSSSNSVGAGAFGGLLQKPQGAFGADLPLGPQDMQYGYPSMQQHQQQQQQQQMYYSQQPQQQMYQPPYNSGQQQQQQQQKFMGGRMGNW
jgi:hypothetical protein